MLANIFTWVENNGHAAFIDAFLAVASLIVAFTAIKINHGTQMRLEQIEKQRESDRIYDRKKARLKAKSVKELRDKGCSLYLQVENTSDSAVAKEIEIILDEKKIQEHDDNINRNTITTLGPNSSARFLLNSDKKGDVIFSNITITWKDETDEQGHYQSTISYL